MNKVALGYLMLSSLVLISTFGSATAITSPTKTYHFLWGTTYLGASAKMEWWITAPVYAAPSDQMSLHLYYYFHTALSVSTERLEVTATLTNGAKQQIYYSILWQGDYPAGTSGSRDASMAIPSNAKQGSSLNVTVYTDLNAWTLFPTEIRTKSYDDLESAYQSANQQVTNLQTEKSNLQSQINTLNSEKTNMQSQINNLQSQLDDIRVQNTTVTNLALFAIVVAGVFVVTTVFFAVRKPKAKAV